jgi:photosystem II stability/assembly factor-like uncharacterized protein
VEPVPFVYQDGRPENPQSGRISAIAVDPRDSSHWLIGAGNGGVWETHDFGGSWLPIADDAPTLAVGAVAFAPSDPSIVFVGTGEAANTSFVHVGAGLLKSTDGGRSWSLLAQENFARGSVRRLVVAPDDANILMAATVRGGFGRDSRDGAPSPPPFGIHKSTDGGGSWVRTLAGQATALEVDRANFNRQYAAIADQRLGVIRDTPDASANGIYRSVDGGVTWSRVEGPWGTDPGPTRSTVGRIELAMSPSNPNIVYAGMQLPPNGGGNALGLLGLYRTDNAWADSPSWIEIPTDATGAGGYCGPSKCGYSHVLSVDPTEPNTLFAGGAEDGFWRCTSCDASPIWTNTTRTAGVHSDHHALAWAGNRLILGNDGGVWSTVDLGATWQNHNRTLKTTMFYGAALHPGNDPFILAGARDFQVSVFRGNIGWRILPHSAAGNWGEAEVAISFARPATDWMVAWIWGRIQRTTDGGRTGMSADDGIDKTGVAFVAPVRKCPARDDTFVTGTNRVWRTDNFFNSSAPAWTANSPARPFPERGFNALNYPHTILSVAFVAGDRECNTYAYGTRGGEVQLTRDGGRTWIDLDPTKALPARPINSLAFDPSAPDRLFAAISSFNEATPDKPGHVFRSDNAMSASPTWQKVGPPADVPFANFPFNVVAIDPTDPRRVYAGSDNGLWQSTDGGSSWTRVGRESGLPPASIYDIQISGAGRTVIFTYGRGAFQLIR